MESFNRLAANRGRAASAVWGGPFVLGLLLAITGVLGIFLAGLAGIVTVLTLGILLTVGGVFECVSAFKTRAQGEFLRPFLSGLFSLVVGVLFVARPVVGLAAISLLLAGFFFAMGLFRGITAVLDRYAHWGWDLFYGVVAVALGVMIMASWPVSSLVVVGTLVGVELLARGCAVMGASLAMRRALRPASSVA